MSSIYKAKKVILQEECRYRGLDESGTVKRIIQRLKDNGGSELSHLTNVGRRSRSHLGHRDSDSEDSKEKMEKIRGRDVGEKEAKKEQSKISTMESKHQSEAETLSLVTKWLKIWSSVVVFLIVLCFCCALIYLFAIDNTYDPSDYLARVTRTEEDLRRMQEHAKRTAAQAISELRKKALEGSL